MTRPPGACSAYPMLRELPDLYTLDATMVALCWASLMAAAGAPDSCSPALRPRPADATTVNDSPEGRRRPTATGFRLRLAVSCACASWTNCDEPPRVTSRARTDRSVETVEIEVFRMRSTSLARSDSSLRSWLSTTMLVTTVTTAVTANNSNRTNSG